MSVLVDIQTPQSGTQEYKAIAFLKSKLEKEFEELYQDADGRINLYANMNLYGSNGKGVSDLDIMIMGNLQGVVIPLKYQDHTYDYNVKSFVVTVEQKSHSEIAYENTNFYVEYSGERKAVSEQSRAQMNALRNFFRYNYSLTPIINNIIFFSGITQEQLFDVAGKFHNAVAADCTFENIMQARLNAMPTEWKENGVRTISMSQDPTMFDAIKCVFEKKMVRAALGITLQKVELLTNRAIEGDCERLLGNKFTILRGRAGTGKTITLLQAAIKQSETKRSVILTYNHALLGDIQRLIKYRNISCGNTLENLIINSAEGYFCLLMKEYGVEIGSNEYMLDFAERYGLALSELNDRLSDQEVKQREEYLFIDEAQDWSNVEREVLFKLFPPEQIVVADGVDQYVRNGNCGQVWDSVAPKNQAKIERNISLRQKCNLVDFVNGFAEKAGIDWSIKRNSSFVGGKIIVFGPYDFGTDVYKHILEECKKSGGTQYDVLFLVPPLYVDKAKGFRLKGLFENNGIKLFDGTSPETRRTIPMGDDESRVFQYDSCRGLEGWCTLCVAFDLLIEYKTAQFESVTTNQMVPRKEIALKKAFLWALMPLTRAIDTLVITLDNPNSEVGMMLKEMSQMMDCVEWRVSNKK